MSEGNSGHLSKYFGVGMVIKAVLYCCPGNRSVSELSRKMAYRMVGKDNLRKALPAGRSRSIVVGIASRKRRPLVLPNQVQGWSTPNSPVTRSRSELRRSYLCLADRSRPNSKRKGHGDRVLAMPSRYRVRYGNPNILQYKVIILVTDHVLSVKVMVRFLSQGRQSQKS